MNKDKSITSTMKENIKLYINKGWFKEYNKYKEKYIWTKKVLKDINNIEQIKMEIREERKFNSNEDYYSKYNKYKSKYEEAKEKLHYIRRGTKPIKQALEELRLDTKKELESLRKEINLLKEKINTKDRNETKDLINNEVLKGSDIIEPITKETVNDIKIVNKSIIKEELNNKMKLEKNTINNELDSNIKINNDPVDHKLSNYRYEKINDKNQLQT